MSNEIRKLTDEQRLRWLNAYVQGENFITFREEDGGVVVHFGIPGVGRSTAGDSVEDCIDQLAELYPYPV